MKQVTGKIRYTENGIEKEWNVAASLTDSPETLKWHFERWFGHLDDCKFIRAELIILDREKETP